MHEFFFERDYPDTRELERVYERLSDQPVFKGSLARTLGLDDEVLERRLDKLWVHGGALIDHDDQVLRGHAEFRRTYPKQRASRAAQIAHMARYIYGESCRMLALVRHFGDQEDGGEACGLCDRCRPDPALMAASEASASERARRKERHGHAAFGSRVDPHAAGAREAAQAGRRGRPARRRAEAQAARGGVHGAHDEAPDAPAKLVEALRMFRREEAKARAIPAFRVLTDRVLYAVAQGCPSSESELLEIHGVGPLLAKKYGPKLIAIVREHTR
jgi:superfamily II DNA helicase RecQ